MVNCTVKKKSSSHSIQYFWPKIRTTSELRTWRQGWFCFVFNSMWNENVFEMSFLRNIFLGLTSFENEKYSDSNEKLNVESFGRLFCSVFRGVWARLGQAQEDACSAAWNQAQEVQELAGGKVGFLYCPTEYCTLLSNLYLVCMCVCNSVRRKTLCVMLL